MTHPTDFRALCAELASLLSKTQPNPYNAFEDRNLKHEVESALKIALAALAAPQQGALTLGDIYDLCEETEFVLGIDGAYEDESAEGLLEIVRLAFTRYGAQAVPVAVAERLPDRSDCNSEGRCWWLMESLNQELRPPPTWALGQYRIKPGTWRQTHWLPHWALPLPEAQP